MRNKMRRPREGFVSIAAQSDNLGDLVIRRVAVDWLQARANLHVFAGNTPSDYIDAYELPQSSRIYRGSATFLRKLVSTALRGGADFMISPGPITRARRTGLEVRARVNLANARFVKLNGGRVFVLGRAVRGGLSRALTAETKLSAIADAYWVRDPISEKLVGGNALLAPDLAFAAKQPFPESPSELTDRGAVAFSLRGDEVVSEEKISLLVDEAAALGLRPIFVTQVRRDDAQHRQLAERFNAECIGWEDQPHREQLERVVKAYERSAIVVSNRLHGVVFGVRSGAGALVVQRTSQGDKLSSTLSRLIHYESVDLAEGFGPGVLDRALSAAPRTQADASRTIERIEERLHALQDAFGATELAP